MPRTALIHDWLDKYGGAERVITAISEIMRFDYYYAYFKVMPIEIQQKMYVNNDIEIIDSKLFRPFKNFFRLLMPFYPILTSTFNKQTKKNKIDVVVSSSWALSKSYRSSTEIHICYLQARNFKYIWEESSLYFKGPLKYMTFIISPLRKFDIKASKNPDYLIANSIFVKEWIKNKYDRESTVIYPPVEIDDFYLSPKEDFYIIVGRIEPYKRFDIVIDAFNANGKKLVVIGDGSQYENLKSISKVNIEFIGFQNKDVIKKYLSKAKAFIFSGVEDFGIAIVEALASGTPVITFNGGAAAELIIDGKNGLLYNEQNSLSLNEKIYRFELISNQFDSSYIKESASKFSKQRFQKEFLNFYNNVLNKHGIK